MTTTRGRQRTWGIPGALPAYAEPYLALAAALQDAPPVPCQHLGEPLSDDPGTRLQAAQLCTACPVLDLCRAAGEQECHGIWGGIDRTQVRPRRRKP